MTHLITLALALLAFVALAVAMHRHQSDLFGREWPPARCRAARGTGFALLAASLGSAVHGQGWSLGLVAWCGHLTAAAGLVAIALITIERRKPAASR